MVSKNRKLKPKNKKSFSKNFDFKGSVSLIVWDQISDRY